ncbi:MAG: hypothetical protein AUI36_34500 [Cyanobacteria bacterium 13_1_40CM_2_61_4]|nr:MAG: hypothetical protein AUI36_34500 [Cyanobacteria bacterium 13_1_40CM_2_61_4]
MSAQGEFVREPGLEGPGSLLRLPQRNGNRTDRGWRSLVAQLPPFEVAALRPFRMEKPQDLKSESLHYPCWLGAT